ncbi:esterase/lipase family protein [Actinomadura litoris]|uniref:DUF676 domain-containing protein n=1 Tax=Actinomadura litoris TaxID=2678616 RepID=A0A7K1LAC4_9ACTN|nr:hypothetical protein [Actinomadura litoris]MUN41135.1 hypothetical protein [Actinomadura litoris]
MSAWNAVAKLDPFKTRIDEEVSSPPPPDQEWRFADEGGTAWVFHAEGRQHLARPVILSDGFHGGPTVLNDAIHNLEFAGYPFLSELRREGYDLIILGYQDCAASILDNARAATACVKKAIAERRGEAKLAVGGFSMGGIITRYALAAMEHAEDDHQTGTYVSYDSPHHGAWLPVAVQAFAHWVAEKFEGADGFSKLVDSPAARQLLEYHIAAFGEVPRVDPLRREFLAKLTEVGSWPKGPRKIGVANGTGDGMPNGVPPGEKALITSPPDLITLYTQESGAGRLVANVFGEEQRTDDLPMADGAPGGLLDFFRQLAQAVNDINLGISAEAVYPWTSFVPSISAMAAKTDKPWDNENLYGELANLASEFDDFKFADIDERHTDVTEDLCTWIIKELGEA